MTVLLFKRYPPADITFSKPFKQDHAYRMTIQPKAFVQTCDVVCQTPLMDRGETCSLASFVIPPMLREWIKGIDRAIVDHAKASKEQLFGTKEISDEFIEASYKSCLTGENTMTMRVSKDVVVYDDKKEAISPEEIPKNARVVLIVSPNHVDFGKRNFACRWSILAIRKAAFDFIEDDEPSPASP